jgi:hypothetical protein
MQTRRLVAVGLTLAALGGGLTAGAAPAAAQAQGEPFPVAGNFVGDEREEVFVYVPGTGTDRLISFWRDELRVISTSATTFRVDGSYWPVAGNFDGDAHDEIIWYGRGTLPDYVWNFAGSSATSTPLSISGGYVPVAGDYTGDGIDDVAWYGPGRDADHLWTFAADGTHRSTPLAINGYYQPVSGSFGTDATDDIFFYGINGQGADSLWDFRAGAGGAFRSRPFQVTGAYEPIGIDLWGDGAGGGDIFWYAPGTGTDRVWDWLGGALRPSFDDRINGQYWPIVVADLFADGSEDVLWFPDDRTADQPVHGWDHIVFDGDDTLSRSRFTLEPRFWAQGTVVTQGGEPTEVTRR